MAELTLSNRCRRVKEKNVDDIFTYLRISEGDPFHPKTNPEGYINLGTAVNGVNADMINEKFSSIPLESGGNLYEYFPEHGTPRLQKAMAGFLTEFFETPQPVQADNVYFVTSAGSAIDILAYCLADPGDVFIGATPVYTGITNSLSTRSLIDLWPIPLTSQGEKPFVLTLEKVELAYEQAIKSKKHVRGMILLNPGNPIADIIKPEVLYEILMFCYRHELHVIVDEVYAMSVHSPVEGESFHSVLKFPSIPDANRTHVIYGLSKDIALTKLRVGVIHTYNEALKNQLKAMAPFQCVAYPIMEMAASFLEDREWCKTLFSSSRQILAAKCKALCAQLESLNLVIHRTPAAIYVWVNFKHYCNPLTFQSEENLFVDILSKSKLIIYPGRMFGASEPGWFRILFAQSEEVLKTGMDRLSQFLTSFHRNEHV